MENLGTVKKLRFVRSFLFEKIGGVSLAVNKKIIHMAIVGSVGISAFASFLVCADRGYVRQTVQAEENQQISVVSHIDSVEITETVMIQGWALILGEEFETVDCSVVLVGEQSKKQIKLPTMIVKRDDLTTAFSDGIDYANAGFLANISKKKLSLETEDYEIYLSYHTNGHSAFINTGEKVRTVREVVWTEMDTSTAEISYSIDNISAKQKVLTVRGWLFRKESKTTRKTEVLLFNTRTKKAYLIPTDIEEREDLKLNFPLIPSVELSGFCAAIETWRFDFGYDEFEICLRVTENEEIYMIHTGRYVSESDEK